VSFFVFGFVYHCHLEGLESMTLTRSHALVALAGIAAGAVGGALGARAFRPELPPPPPAHAPIVLPVEDPLGGRR
jgi:hypothetical protein